MDGSMLACSVVVQSQRCFFSLWNPVMDGSMSACNVVVQSQCCFPVPGTPIRTGVSRHLML